MPKIHKISETAALAEVAAKPVQGRMSVVAISAGLGSSGYYSPAVIEQAAKDKLITRGTPLHLDHPTDEEAQTRPGRSVTTIAGVFTGDAVYESDTQALVGEVQFFTPWKERIAEMAPYIGLSISGSATDVTEGDDGRPVIEGLAAIDSVDLVTRAGRGGRIVDLLESADASRRAIGHGISEATANDTREALQTAVNDAYSGERKYAYVRDFDETTVWFNAEAGSDSGIFAQMYTITDGVVTLTGTRVEVRVKTTYVPVKTTEELVAPKSVPVNDPAGRTNTTEESKEDTVAKVEIEEAELGQLREGAGRVTTLISERDTAIAERDTAQAERDQVLAENHARRIISEQKGITFSPLEVRGLLAGLPLKEGALDVEVFTKIVTDQVEEAKKEAAAAAESAGAGSVYGMGTGTTTPTGSGKGITEDAFHAGLGIVKTGA